MSVFSVRLPRRGTEDRRQQERIGFVLGRDGIQASGETDLPSLGCGPLFGGRLLGRDHARSERDAKRRQNGEKLHCRDLYPGEWKSSHCFGTAQKERQINLFWIFQILPVLKRESEYGLSRHFGPRPVFIQEIGS